MKKPIMILSGGSGYLGSLIINHFKDEYHIKVLTRSKSENVEYEQVVWDGKTVGDWAKALEGADVLINLAGKSINSRFTLENKKAILKSRIDTTEVLGKAIETCVNPPKHWLNASSVAIYKESKAVAKDEASPTDGEDFLSIVSQKWEEAFYKYADKLTLKTCFRISLILGDDPGSALSKLKILVKTGGGGPAGSGEQMVSWMGEKDFVSALSFLIDKKLSGAFNFCVPKPLSNAELMQELRTKYHVPFGLPAPSFLVRLGTLVIGTSPKLILRSQNVVPARLLEEGYEFKQPEIKDI